MDSAALLKRIGVLFLIVLALYLAAFFGLEGLRRRNAPWEVTFTTNATGTAAVHIRQPNLNIRDFTLLFPEESPPPGPTGQRLRFAEPQTWPFAIPYGQCIFEDLTFLPGTVTLQVFGHEVELLPRTLIVDRREQSWTSGSPLSLWATNKVPPKQEKPRKK
jgi:hypothetical protein